MVKSISSAWPYCYMYVYITSKKCKEITILLQYQIYTRLTIRNNVVKCRTSDITKTQNQKGKVFFDISLILYRIPRWVKCVSVFIWICTYFLIGFHLELWSMWISRIFNKCRSFFSPFKIKIGRIWKIFKTLTGKYVWVIRLKSTSSSNAF